MKAKLAGGLALLTACSGSGGNPVPTRAESERAQGAEAAGDVAGGETSEFSGGIGRCPDIVSSEPIDLADPEVASWVGMARGHHEQTLGWRRLVLSDEVAGFAEHTSVSIDVEVLGGRMVQYGLADNPDPELTGCAGFQGRQIELEITLATADGAVAATFRNWFTGAVTDTRGVVLQQEATIQVDLNGTLELGLDPALGGTPEIRVSIELSADSVRGSLSPEVWNESTAWNRSGWLPIEAAFPDDPCGINGRSLGLDEVFSYLGGTPRAFYEPIAAALRRQPIPAIWRSSPSNVQRSPLDVPLDVPPRTSISLNAGEPTEACDLGTSVGVYAPVTVTTADGLVSFTQPFAFNVYRSNAYIVERTPWVPAADFNEHSGLSGVNLEGGYGSISFYNNIDWQYGWAEGAIEVSQWEGFTDRRAAYPVLEWCRNYDCPPDTE